MRVEAADEEGVCEDGVQAGERGEGFVVESAEGLVDVGSPR